VYVPRKDFEYGQALVRRSPNPGDHGAYIKADLEVPAKRLRLVDQDEELVEGVNLINLPGHTPGLLGLAVELARDGTLIFPQDAVYTRANYGPPARLSGIVHDSLAFLDSVEKVRSLAGKSGGRVMFSHDMEFFDTTRRAPDYYE
jgi:glyoxylase-like metal-dependent hydrolase (beta-lactamase superfamily II)